MIDYDIGNNINHETFAKVIKMEFPTIRKDFDLYGDPITSVRNLKRIAKRTGFELMYSPQRTTYYAFLKYLLDNKDKYEWWQL